MKRFPRWLFNRLCGVLPTLCVAATAFTLVLLIAGIWRFDRLMLDANRGNSVWLLHVVSSRGGLGIDVSHYWEIAPSHASIHFSWERDPVAIYPDFGGHGTPSFNWYSMGFQLRHDDYIGSDTTAIVLPEPIFLLLCLTILWRFIIRRRRIPPGLCQICGYDLRATPEQCPECGAAATKKENLSN